MREAKDKTLALNVRLKPSEPSAHPRAANYTNVGVAQGIASVDFGFIEPTLLAAIAKTAKDGPAATKGLDGALRHPRRDGRRRAGPVASADTTSFSRHARSATAEAECLGTRAVPNSKCAITRPDRNSLVRNVVN